MEPETTAPGHTIASAGTLTLGNIASGGGGPIDFWKAKLNGGDQIQFTADYPNSTYVFSLYAPGTTDGNLSTTGTFSSFTTFSGVSQQTFTLQAPYNGTIVLAVCQNVSNNNCSNEPTQGGTNPMGAYTFSTLLLPSSPSPATAAKETQASPQIAGARPIGSTTIASSVFEAGGGAPIDFWKMKLNGGDQIQFTADYPNSTYTFSLYAPGTTDANLSTTGTFSTFTTFSGVSQQTFTLQAPYNGTFILAVCQNVSNNNCSNEPNQGGTNPMNPYTFKALVAGGPSATTAAGETQASPTIAGAHAIGSTTISSSVFEAGGGAPIDFWKMKLNGGDQVRFTAGYPNSTYTFSLYAPGTTDANLSTTGTFSTFTTFSGVSQQTFTLQAPYNGTFILAVCQNVSNNNCSNEPNQGGTNPMNPYTFKTLVTGGPSAGTAARETRAAQTIARAPAVSTGLFEAGGGAPIDFWRMPLNGGDQVQFTADYPNSTYTFDLYAPGTTDGRLPITSPLDTFTTFSGVTQQTFTFQVPKTGTFILAVCQNVSNNDCSNEPSQGGTNPMNPYTFSTVFTGGPQTRTSLKLSAASVRFTAEKSLKLTATVAGVFDGTASGKVVITAGKTAVCTIAKLSGGRGTCSPASNTLLKVGTYTLTATYHGNLAPSAATAKLTVTPNRPTSTTLKLSATRVTVGHEKSLKLTAAVKAISGGTPAGKIVITAGSKTVCTIATLVKGAGTCSPASNTLLKAGTYKLAATYSGNFASSTSKVVVLTVKS